MKRYPLEEMIIEAIDKMGHDSFCAITEKEAERLKTNCLADILDVVNERLGNLLYVDEDDVINIVGDAIMMYANFEDEGLEYEDICDNLGNWRCGP